MRPLILLTLLTACASGPGTVHAGGKADAFSLRLHPIVAGAPPQRAAALVAGGRLSLWLDGAQVATPEQDGEGNYLWPELDPFSETRLGLRWTDDAGETLAWGLSPTFSIDEGERDITVWLASPRTLTITGAPTGLETPAGAAFAVAQDGDLWAFGGASVGSTALGEPIALSEHTWRAARDQQNPVFSSSTSLPSDNLWKAGRAFSTATPVTWRGQPAILVVGGVTDLSMLSPPNAGIVLWDPVSGSPLAKWTMPKTQLSGHLRARHVAIAREDGRVLVIGGTDDRINLSWDLIDPETQNITPGGQADGLAGWGVAVTALADGGVAACGGGYGVGSSSPVSPTTGCIRIAPDALTSTALPPLPQGVIGASLTELSDGSLLLAGGLDTATGQTSATDATHAAFLLGLGSSAWQALAPMKHARVHHQAIALDDDHILMLGGVDRSSAPPVAHLGAGACAEVYVRSTAEWQDAPDCLQALGGAWPQLAYAEGDGIFVVGGSQQVQDQGIVSGQAWGWIARPPPSP